jgi:iron complex outermembrane recepter protein
VGNYPVNNYTRTQEDYVLPSYALVNTMISYDFKLAGINLTATLNVDNVLNRLYMDRTGGTEFMTGAPRNWRFSMDYKF